MNDFLLSFVTPAIVVLIDTWWNVNQEFVDSLLRLSGFNRYMVECE